MFTGASHVPWNSVTVALFRGHLISPNQRFINKLVVSIETIAAFRGQAGKWLERVRYFSRQARVSLAKSGQHVEYLLQAGDEWDASTYLTAKSATHQKKETHPCHGGSPPLQRRKVCGCVFLLVPKWMRLALTTKQPPKSSCDLEQALPNSPRRSARSISRCEVVVVLASLSSHQRGGTRKKNASRHCGLALFPSLARTHKGRLTVTPAGPPPKWLT